MPGRLLLFAALSAECFRGPETCAAEFARCRRWAGRVDHHGLPGTGDDCGLGAARIRFCRGDISHLIHGGFHHVR